MNDQRVWRVLSASAAGVMGCALLGACAHPFETVEEDYGPRVAVERLRAIEPLEIDRFASAEDIPAEDELRLDPPRDPFDGRERVPVTLEQARAWTLGNNLDLRVALVDPVIANERLDEEEARFEAVFTADVRYSNIDQATDTALSGNQVESWNITPGVRIPLRTGGTASLDFPFARTETDNQFATLNPSYANDARFSISQPLLRGAGRRANTHAIRIQALETQISEARTKLEVIRVLAAVDRAYWSLYNAVEVLEVREEQYRLALAQLEQAQRRVNAEVAAEIEVIRAQEGVAQRIEGIILAQVEVKRQQRELKRIMNVAGLDVDSAVVLELVTEPDPIPYELSESDLARAAITNRMELLELELRLAQDLSTIDFQKNQALPLFTLDYSYNLNSIGGSLSDSLGTLRSRDFADHSLGLNLEIPLGNEAAEARVHQAILRRLQRLSSRSARELAIRQEVLDAVDVLQSAWRSILAARQTVILAGRTLEAERSAFSAGLSTSTDVLDAATRLADAQQLEIASLTRYQTAQVDLAFATGTLLGASRVLWDPEDPRDADDFYGEREGEHPEREIDTYWGAASDSEE